MKYHVCQENVTDPSSFIFFASYFYYYLASCNPQSRWTDRFILLACSRVSAANEWDVELNARKEIPYLRATTYHFVYHINTMALYWEEKPTTFMNEYKWIDNPQITIVGCVGANSQDRRMRWITNAKTTMVVIFNLQNSHLLTLSLPTEEVFQVNSQNRLVENLPVVDFHSQPREMLTPKPLNR